MNFLILFLVSVFASMANAYVVPTYRDIKPSTQQMIEKQTITNPLLGTATRLSSAHATSSTLVTTITTFTAQPDVPRNIILTTGGTTSSCSATTVVVNGTNFYGKTLSENFTVTSTQNGVTTGAKAFASVTSIVIPAQTNGSGCTMSFGTGTKLGLKSCMASADHFMHAGYGGVKETTAPTIAVGSATDVSQNTAILNSALDGAHTVILFYMQNFICHN